MLRILAEYAGKTSATMGQPSSQKLYYGLDYLYWNEN